LKLVPRKQIDADDNLGRGMDMALVILVFLGVGYGLDRWLDTEPLFMVGLVVFALVGQFVAMWYRYDAAMQVHETARREGARARTPGSEAGDR
jgi:F0F1-type ATP synthase assembly protein I